MSTLADSTATLLDSTDALATSERDPYRGVVIVLLIAASVGMAAAFVAGVTWANRVLLDVSVTLGLSAGILAGVAMSQAARVRSATYDDLASQLDRLAGPVPLAPHEPPPDETSTVTVRLASAMNRFSRWFRRFSGSDTLGMRIAAGGLVAMGLVWFFNRPLVLLTWQVAATGGAACLLAAAIAAVAVHYLGEIDPEKFPEARGLAQGARMVAWVLVLGAASIGLAWADQPTGIQVVHIALIVVNAVLCYDLATVIRSPSDPREAFPLDLGVVSALGSRPNILASLLDAAERQLGIDLRSTWALTVIRRSLEPLVVGLCVMGWLSTALTVVGPEEQGLVERFGVPVQGDVLSPGIHVHWPSPIDRVFRLPVRRVQMLSVGHEGQEEGGPEDVLWARQHAANEYTLLLGNGRDLVTIDAGVQYRIADPRAWRYHSQNPADALRAIAYRAVMRNTVNHTLAEALSENVVSLTGRMREQVQQEADALGLGVEILGFTVGGMHPPVAVAYEYQAVVSAALRKVTTVVDAQVYRNRVVPRAESNVIAGGNRARAESADALGRATGESASFLTLQSQHGADPQEFFFRRRLETLEKDLTGRAFTVLDSRFQRDGGELWVTP
jgi:regulator of protease activity HflC (stomatin/prohibitin superfamily)